MSGTTNQVNTSNKASSMLFASALLVAWLPFMGISFLAGAFDSTLNSEALLMNHETKSDLVRTNVLVQGTQLWSFLTGLVLSANRLAETNLAGESKKAGKLLYCYVVPMLVVSGTCLVAFSFVCAAIL